MKYHLLAETYQQLEKTSKRLEKTSLLAEFLKHVQSNELPEVCLLLQGRVYPLWDERKLGIAAQLMIKALHAATGLSLGVIEKEWKKTGDLGLVAERLMATRRQATLVVHELTVSKVFHNLQKLAALAGSGSVGVKINGIVELLSSSTPREAKYLVRTVLEDLRIGVGDGSLRDALVWAFLADDLDIRYQENELLLAEDKRPEYNRRIALVQIAYDLTNDLGMVALCAKQKGLPGLEAISLKPGIPTKVMLAQKVQDFNEGFEAVGKPCCVEYKLDGFRIQIHATGKEILLFTRRLENVTLQFPEVVAAVRQHVTGNSFILDGEAVGYDPKTGKCLPFQSISQRIKRKYHIAAMAKQFPVCLYLFDVLFCGESVVQLPFMERRKLLQTMVQEHKRAIEIVPSLITEDEQEAQAFYAQALSVGMEGVMLKKLDAPYKPGSRVGFMVKLKPIMEPLDLVITGAEWGEGKRSNWLTSYTLACRDNHGSFGEIGKVGTGIKELEGSDVTFAEMTRLLKPLIIQEKGKIVTVKPKVVVEIAYEEIQKSPTYSSGFALRFPRLQRLRSMERSPEDISTLTQVQQLYSQQKGASP